MDKHASKCWHKFLHVFSTTEHFDKTYLLVPDFIQLFGHLAEKYGSIQVIAQGLGVKGTKEQAQKKKKGVNPHDLSLLKASRKISP